MFTIGLLVSVNGDVKMLLIVLLNLFLPCMSNFGIGISSRSKNLLANIEVCEPLKHTELLKLLIKCKLVITDSGGLQEECSFLNKKCLVCRETTERPESIGLTTFMVKSPIKLINLFSEHIYNYNVEVESPFGDGKSSEKICNVLIEL